MSDTKQITIYYADGTPTETRDMTPEEIDELLLSIDEADETPRPN